MNNDLFVKGIEINRDKINKTEGFDKYPFNIELVKNFKGLNFSKPVTFFVGENGIGKSTFSEAIAVSLGLPKEGGTQNFFYETKDTTSILSDYLIVSKLKKPKMRFFLRAESFYNFSTEVDRLVDENGFYELY
ncbi:MAG: AAA family ATPase, partial [Clostridiales bacterium]|nr:AAA family ATPase [Clostridiales bacterium]